MAAGERAGGCGRPIITDERAELRGRDHGKYLRYRILNGSALDVTDTTYGRNVGEIFRGPVRRATIPALPRPRKFASLGTRVRSTDLSKYPFHPHVNQQRDIATIARPQIEKAAVWGDGSLSLVVAVSGVSYLSAGSRWFECTGSTACRAGGGSCRGTSRQRPSCGLADYTPCCST